MITNNNISKFTKTARRLVIPAILASTLLASAPAAQAGPFFYWGFFSFASEGGLGTTR